MDQEADMDDALADGHSAVGKSCFCRLDKLDFVSFRVFGFEEQGAIVGMM